MERSLIYQKVSQILTQSADIDTGAGGVLELIGRELGASRISVFENTPDSDDYCSNTFEWCAEGVVSVRDSLQNIPYAECSCRSMFEHDRFFCCSDTVKSDESICRLLEPYHARSMLGYAFYSSGKFYGFVGIADCVDPEPEWRRNKELQEMIVYTAEMLALYLLKERSLQKAAAAERLVSEHKRQLEMSLSDLNGLLDALNKDAVLHYTVDMTAGRLCGRIYRNGGFTMAAGSDEEGYVSFESLVDYIRRTGIAVMDDMRHLAFDREEILKLFETGQTHFEFHTHDDRDDSYIRILVLLHRNEDNGHVIARYIHHDETIQKRTEIELKNQERLSLEVIQALSADFENIYIVNTADMTVEVRKQAGYTVDRVPIGQSIRLSYDDAWSSYIGNTVHPDDVEALLEARRMDRILEELEHRSEYTHTFRAYLSGKLFYIQLKITRLDEQRIILGFRDTSSLVEEENKHRMQLEDALQAAEQANRAKTVFLNNVSHDIRTPMNAIIGYTLLAEEHLSDTARVQSYLKKIQTSSRHLLSLINDVLDMSRIESGMVTLKETRVSLSQILHGVNDIVDADIRSKQQYLEVVSERVTNDIVWCDKIRLCQVLLNCLSNSIKYTPEGGSISLRLIQTGCSDTGYASYEIRVKDTGIGMSEEFLEHIFEPFTREQNSTVSGVTGTGLGMSICRNMVELMGGTIHVNSNRNAGTEFIIQLNFRICTAEEAAKVQEEICRQSADNGKYRRIEKYIRGMKVLLVEDNELNREIAAELLMEKGAEVAIAVNGAEAVETVIESEKGSLDLILMDIQMPVMNGYEAASRIRSLPDPEKAAIPIIALSANAFEEDRKRSEENGINAHMSKPIDISELTEVIGRIMKKDGND